MASLEQTAKAHFARVYVADHWHLFKLMAEGNLAEAAVLTKASFSKLTPNYRLLARNSRKRLLIGVGVELLLKAAYLKLGYGINRPIDRDHGPKLPFKLEAVNLQELDPTETFSLSQLIEQLKKVIDFAEPDAVLKGLRIAKVFRNKEGHVIAPWHTFDPEEYASIETALKGLYATVFKQHLTVRIAVAETQRGRNVSMTLLHPAS